RRARPGDDAGPVSAGRHGCLSHPRSGILARPLRGFMTLLWRMLLGGLRDLAPGVVVIFFFQLVVLCQPAANLLGLLEGAVLVVVGLTLFIYGLQLALFPLGEALAFALAERGSFLWLLAFAFLLGFGTTIAEPALTAVAAEAARAAAAAGAIENT